MLLVWWLPAVLSCSAVLRPGLAADNGGTVKSLHSAEEALRQLEGLVAREHPLARAARRERDVFLSRQEAVESFRDPGLSASAGRSGRLRTLPGVSGLREGFSEHAWSAQAAVELPVQAGAYLSAGIGEQYLEDTDARPGDLVQTRAAVGLRIPLARDRGLREWRLRVLESGVMSDYGRALVLSERQRLKRETALYFVNWLAARAEVEVSRNSAERLRSLYEESRQRAELKVLPAYQVEPARMEWTLQEEAAEAAAAASAVALARLRSWVGENWSPGSFPRDVLVSWAAAVELPAVADVGAGRRRRGAWAPVGGERAAGEVREEQAGEQLRADLALEISASWQGEDESGIWGDERILSDKHGGAQALLVWRRTWGRDRERAELAAARAGKEASEARFADLERTIIRDLEVYARIFNVARRRLDMVGDAVAAAEETLRAERERFHLGEGRSRNVLDAQKDLTDAVRRQNVIAVELLHSWAAYRYAAGYPGEPAVDIECHEKGELP